MPDDKILGQRVSQTVFQLRYHLKRMFWPPNYVPPSAKRDAAIYAERQSGATLRAIGARYGISRDRVRMIVLKKEEIRWAYARRWPVAVGGHPSFDDPYGVDQVFTPRQQFLDDRFLLGKEIGE